MTKRMIIFKSCLVFLFWLSSSFAQAPPVNPPHGWMPSEALPIERVGPGVFRMGEIQAYKDTRSVTFPARVNMDKGLLEYFLVRSGGKTHESALSTDVEPYYLNIAFLLLGFEGTDDPLAEQGAAGSPKGEAIEVTILYRENDTDKKVRAEEWIEKRTGKKNFSPSMDWRYTGSMVSQGTFLAQTEGSIIAIYHDPTAMIDHATSGGESDEIWFVKDGVLPETGTPVTVIIKAKK